MWLPKSVNRFSERFDIQSSSLNAIEVYFLLLQGNAWMRGHSLFYAELPFLWLQRNVMQCLAFITTTERTTAAHI